MSIIRTMNIARKTTFFLGIFIFVIPFLGFPSFWKEIFTAVSGVFLVLLSVRIAIPKRTSRTRTQRERSTPVFVESAPVYPQNDTVESISQVSIPQVQLEPRVEIPEAREIRSETVKPAKVPKPAVRRTRVTKKSNVSSL